MLLFDFYSAWIARRVSATKIIFTIYKSFKSWPFEFSWIQQISYFSKLSYTLGPGVPCDMGHVTPCRTFVRLKSRKRCCSFKYWILSSSRRRRKSRSGHKTDQQVESIWKLLCLERKCCTTQWNENKVYCLGTAMEKYQWSHSATKQLHQTIHVGCGRNDASIEIVIELPGKNGGGTRCRAL